MIELNKDYQKTVNLMTYLSQEWGIEKCNFFIYPDEKNHSVAVGLLLPNYNKKRRIKQQNQA